MTSGKTGVSLLALALALALAGCVRDPAAAAPTAPPSRAPLPTLMPTATGAPAPPPAAQADIADTGWQPAAPGAELRRLTATVAGQEAPVTVVRLDPAQVRFSVGYRPDDPPPLAQWAAGSGALATINGGFFDEAGHTVALLVRGGQPVGESYQGRGGMFAVAADGAVSLRSLADQPYDPAEPLAEAIQGWPMLVRPGGEAAYTYEDGQRDRRSAIALDGEGRVLLLVAPTAAFTLAELSSWLAASDLGVASALNLDGGSSSGLLLLSATAPERIDAFAPLPIVLMALPR